MEIYRIKLLRKFFLPLLRVFNPGNITIKHHWVPEKRVFLHSFRHKGYWYHGRDRENDTMKIFNMLIDKGDTIIEVGGHIGYISLYFSELVGGSGRVYVFEPGINNLPYIRKNEKNIMLVEKAVGNCNGQATFYIENLSGQNNSLVKGFDTFYRNRDNAFVKETYSESVVDIIKLDNFIDKENIEPNFIKIDIEGAEFDAIKGMLSYLRKYKPMLMVEVTKNNMEVYNIITDIGYIAFDPQFKVIRNGHDLSDNAFFLHPAIHLVKLEKMGVDIDKRDFHTN